MKKVLIDKNTVNILISTIAWLWFSLIALVCIFIQDKSDYEDKLKLADTPTQIQQNAKIDNSCIQEAIRWKHAYCFGQAKILNYTWSEARFQDYGVCISRTTFKDCLIKDGKRN